MPVTLSVPCTTIVCSVVRAVLQRPLLGWIYQPLVSPPPPLPPAHLGSFLSVHAQTTLSVQCYILDSTYLIIGEIDKDFLAIF